MWILVATIIGFQELFLHSTYLTQLTQKEMTFVCSDKYKEFFQKLKSLLNTTLILFLPAEGKDFVVFFYPSHYGLGIVLMKDINMITYASR